MHPKGAWLGFTTNPCARATSAAREPDNRRQHRGGSSAGAVEWRRVIEASEAAGVVVCPPAPSSHLMLTWSLLAVDRPYSESGQWANAVRPCLARLKAENLEESGGQATGQRRRPAAPPAPCLLFLAFFSDRFCFCRHMATAMAATVGGRLL